MKKILSILSVLFLIYACKSSDLSKILFIGEAFESGNIYLYSLKEKEQMPFKVNYYIIGNKENGIAEFRNIVEGDLDKIESGKSGYFAIMDFYSEFNQYHTERIIEKDSLLFALNNMKAENIQYYDKIKRIGTESDKKIANEYLNNWYANYKKGYNKEYNEDEDVIFGLPQTILDAEKLVSFKIKEIDTNVVISIWSTHSVAFHGLICFVLDIYKNEKLVDSIIYRRHIGAL